jgi:hypothetical protein
MLQRYFEEWAEKEPERARFWEVAAFIATGVCMLFFFVLLFDMMTSTEVHAECHNIEQHPGSNATMFRPDAPPWCYGMLFALMLLLMASISGFGLMCIR